jgi:hypothetical protein
MERGQENNNKQSVVFTHGAVTDYRTWQFQVKPFSRQYRVIASTAGGILIQIK